MAYLTKTELLEQLAQERIPHYANLMKSVEPANVHEHHNHEHHEHTKPELVTQQGNMVELISKRQRASRAYRVMSTIYTDEGRPYIYSRETMRSKYIPHQGKKERARRLGIKIEWQRDNVQLQNVTK